MSNPLLSSRNRILPALITPLTAAGELDVPSLEHLIDHLYSAGVGGLYVTGSTGEGIYLDPAVRKRIAEVAVAHSRGHGQVIVHVASIAAVQAFELAKHAAAIGADAVASIPPFVGGYSWDEVLGYYRRLAQESPLPVVGYVIPVLTGQSFSLDRLSELLHVPNLIGFKFTDVNVYQMQRFMARMSRDVILYYGADEMLSFALEMGAHGGIGTTYNFMPKVILELAQLCGEGKFADAVALQKRVNEVIEILLSFHGVPVTKQILYWQGHLAATICAPPRASLSPQQQSELRARLAPTIIGETFVRP